MNLSEVYRLLLKRLGYTQQNIADVLGIKQPSIADFIAKGNPRLAILQRYLEPLGYDVVLAPKNIRLPESCFALTPKKKQAKED